MNCPKCNCPNRPGATHCQLCSEVFNKSAADRYSHAQRAARRREDTEYREAQEPSAPPALSLKPFKDIHERLAEIDWDGIARYIARFLHYFFQAHSRRVVWGLGIGAGICAILFFTSSSQRLFLFGQRLDYEFPPQRPVTYFIGYHTELKSWSEREGRLDTPLETIELNEVGNFVTQTTPLDTKNRKVLFKPTEWIVSQTGRLSQNIPLNHPSLKPPGMILNKWGRVTQRLNPSTARAGRALMFLAPRWPAGSQRTGAQWDEPAEWVEVIGAWKILWKGKLHWRLAGSESGGETPCLHLVYSAKMTPSIWEAPDWARGGIKAVAFQGTATGDACYDPNQHQIHSNDFTNEGTLQMSIDNIYRIPADLRVGRTPRHRWGEPVAAEAGTLQLQIKNRLGIHKG